MPGSLQAKAELPALNDVSAKTPESSPTARRIKSLYGVMQSIEGQLGGGEGVEGLYGSIKLGGMQRVLAAMKAECNLDAGSCLVDVGAGLGRPLLHAMIAYDIGLTFGVEIDAIKCQKAEAFLRQTHTVLCKRGIVRTDMALPPITCAAIEQVTTLEPATHAYSFWEGVPTEGRMAFGRLFAGSSTLKAVAVVQRAIRREKPADVMFQLGFGGLLLTDSFPVSMSGSGRSFRAYVFKRVSPQQENTNTAEEPESTCPQLSKPLNGKGGITHAVLLDLQLRRIHTSTRPSDTVPRLSAARGAARIPDDARSARRAARSANAYASVSAIRISSASDKVAADSQSGLLSPRASVAHTSASAASSESRSRPPRVSRAVSRPSSSRSAVAESLQSAVVSQESPDTAVDPPIISSAIALSPTKRSNNGGSPLTPKSSPLKSNGSPLKLVRKNGTAQRELWGRVVKTST